MNAREIAGRSGEPQPIHPRVALLDLNALPRLTSDQDRFLQKAIELKGETGIDPNALMHSFVGSTYIKEGFGPSRMRNARTGINRTFQRQEYTPGYHLQLEDVGDKEHPTLDFVLVSHEELEAREAKTAGKAITPLPLPPPHTEYFDPFDHDSVRDIKSRERTDLPEAIHKDALTVLAEVDYLRKEQLARSTTPFFTVKIEQPQKTKDKSQETPVESETNRLKAEILKYYKSLIPDPITFRMFSLLVDGTASSKNLDPDTIYHTFYSGARDNDTQLDVAARIREISFVLAPMYLDVAYRPKTKNESDGYVIVRNNLKKKASTRARRV